jgi:hypothetical protein
VLGVFEIGSPFLSGWFWTRIPLISASQVAGIIGMSLQRLMEGNYFSRQSGNSPYSLTKSLAPLIRPGLLHQALTSALSSVPVAKSKQCPWGDERGGPSAKTWALQWHRPPLQSHSINS